MPTALRVGMALLAGFVIFIGLPLIAWGVADAAGFFDHAARLGYVVVVVVLQTLTVMVMPETGRGRGGGKPGARRHAYDVVLIQVLSLAVVIVAPYGDRHDVATIRGVAFLRYVGLVMLAAGFMVMIWAERALGKQFSVEVTIQEDHALVTNGPYRFLRHPRYLGIMIFTAGIALVFGSWLALIIAAVLAAVLVWRVRDEDRLLRETFGAEWDAYAGRSWRLIPFVY